MPKVEKVLHEPIDDITSKLEIGIGAFGKLMTCRGKWTSECDGKTCVTMVYEKLSLKPSMPHYCLTVTLFDTGEEVRLFATTSGGSNEYWGNPYPDGEGELTSVLNTVLSAQDQIII